VKKIGGPRVRENGFQAGLPDRGFWWDDARMSDTSHATARDLGPHQRAHVAPTTQQVRTIGQRRREAEEKLEQHLQEARRKYEHHQAQPLPEAPRPDKDKRR
jgi:hypothetical protein